MTPTWKSEYTPRHSPRSRANNCASRYQPSFGVTLYSSPNDPTGIEGFPTYAELVERYADRTGRDLSEIDYYIAFGSWRLAVISEGVYARYLHGAMGDQEIDQETLDSFKEGTERLAEDALERLS